MMKKESKSKDLKGWLQRSISLDIEDFDSVVKFFAATVKNHGFDIKN